MVRAGHGVAGADDGGAGAVLGVVKGETGFDIAIGYTESARKATLNRIPPVTNGMLVDGNVDFAICHIATPQDLVV